MERDVTAAFAELGWNVQRANPVDPATGHGFISSQRMGIEVFKDIPVDAPLIVDAARLLSKSKNSPFDGRRLQGQVLMTVVDGRVVHRAEG